MKYTLMLVFALFCGTCFAGEKSEAVQKSATQKNSAVQKGESSGFFTRSRSRRVVRIEARQSRWSAAVSCRSGSCR